MDADLSPAQAAQTLGLPLDGSAAHTPALIRRHYLRRAVRVHPDKCRDPGAVQEFQRLKQAHDLLVARAVGEARAATEAAASVRLLSAFLRALAGELRDAALEAELAALGVHRPPPAFGIDLGVRFQGAQSAHRGNGDTDAEAALRDVFSQQGVPWGEGSGEGGADDWREARDDDASW